MFYIPEKKYLKNIDIGKYKKIQSIETSELGLSICILINDNIKIYSIKNNQLDNNEYLFYESHIKPVTDIFWSPNGEYLLIKVFATINQPGCLKVWGIKAKEILATLPQSGVNNVIWSKGYLITSSNNDGKSRKKIIKIWRIGNWQNSSYVYFTDNIAFDSMCWSEDGKSIDFKKENDTKLYTWKFSLLFPIKNYLESYKSVQELLLFHAIQAAHDKHELYEMTPESKRIFCAIAPNDRSVGDAIRNALMLMISSKGNSKSIM